MIHTRQLRRTFRGRRSTVEAVAGVDLDVEGGQTFGFLGPNGAGKTTTLRMLSTLLPVTSGRATVAGCDLLREPGRVRERIGYVSQEGSSYAEVTGRRELVMQGCLYGMSTADARTRAAELLETLELADCGDRKTRTYSGGQKRRLDVGIGLMHLPQLLFLDEPTTGLDPQSRARMWDEVRRLRESGTTVFLTTHYLEEADALCDRIAIIDHGKIVAEGTPEELKRQVAGDIVLVGTDGPTAPARAILEGQPFIRELTEEDGALRLYVDRGETATPQIIRLLDGAGITLSTLSLHRPSLDDVFFRQTGRSLRETAA
ncbi:MAG: ATP-binding cassette domain-containing protein [Candidatus Dormibacteria bacterium]